MAREPVFDPKRTVRSQRDVRASNTGAMYGVMMSVMKLTRMAPWSSRSRLRLSRATWAPEPNARRSLGSLPCRRSEAWRNELPAR